MQPKPVPTRLEAARHLGGPSELGQGARAQLRDQCEQRPPCIRCSLDFLAPVRRAATSDDEKLSSMAMWTVFSDGMVSGSPVWLRTPATLNVTLRFREAADSAALVSLSETLTRDPGVASAEL